VASGVRRPLLAVLAAVTGALAVAGCVSMPSAGPVLSYPVSQQTGGQNGQNLQITAQPPSSGWTPQQIVNGFLIAAAANQEQVAREYLTSGARRSWDPSSLTTYVYTSRPNVLNPVPQTVPQAGASPSAAPSGKSGKNGKSARKPSPPPMATVEVNGKIQAILSEKAGTYAVPSATGSNSSGPKYFTLQQTDGQWRISDAPPVLLLTQAQFADDFDLRNLYFFDPNYHYLVPDPVYVPLQASASTLTSRLVGYLKSPPEDWLAEGATGTAFPPGDKVSATLAGNLATVNITGTISKAQRAEVVSQLLWTLVGSGQGGSQVESVQLNVNGKPYYPPGSPVNPVLNQSQASYGPATGASGSRAGQLVYYLGSGGEVYSNRVGVAGVAGQQTRVAKIGVGYTQIAVSKDGRYLAALRGASGDLFMGPIGGPLLRQQGSGYTTLSWDPSDNLWTTTGTNEQIFVFRAGASPNSRLSRPIEATVTLADHIVTDYQYTALQIAPDGVRVAMILNADQLTFGAIVWQPGTGTGPGGVTIQLSPFNIADLVSGFDNVTWYGADNVITLGGPTSTLTEYPVNGGTPTSQTLDQTVESITASPGQALIAGVLKGEMIEASNLTGAWATIATSDGTPVKGISPIYPG
jgi:Lipoprotein LpqB beta-propeller domain/Sporulation and spore germination